MDPCPKCGSTNTTVRDFSQEVYEVPQLGGERILVPRNPRFYMSCEDCGHREFKYGYPGQPAA